MVLHIVLACYMKKCLFFSIFNRVFTNLYRKSIKYIDKKYTDSNQYGKFTCIVLRKGDFAFAITQWEGKKACEFELIKEDWIYQKGF